MRRIALIVGTLWLVASSARAEGPGVRLGEALVLHPGLAIGSGYDSNVFYASGQASDNVQGSFYVNLRPAIDLATTAGNIRGEGLRHAFDFRLHAGTSLRFLTSSDSNIAQHYGIGIEAGATMALAPNSWFGLDLYDNFGRSSEPPYGITRTLGNISQDNNQAGVRMRFTPGGRRLEVSPQYVLGAQIFENPEFVDKNYLTHDFSLRISWKFFPKTALVLQAQEQMVRYLNVGPNTPPDSYPFRTTLGLAGLITPVLSLTAGLGYGNSFTGSSAAYGLVNSYNNIVGNLGVSWKPLLFTGFSASYAHDFSQAVVGAYANTDSVTLGIAQGIWRFPLTIRVGWDHRAYQGNLMADFQVNNSSNPRVDDLITAAVQIDFPLKDWLFISLNDTLQKNYSTCAFISNGVPSALACSYFRNDATLRINVAY